MDLSIVYFSTYASLAGPALDFSKSRGRHNEKRTNVIEEDFYRVISHVVTSPSPLPKEKRRSWLFIYHYHPIIPLALCGHQKWLPLATFCPLSLYAAVSQKKIVRQADENLPFCLQKTYVFEDKLNKYESGWLTIFFSDLPRSVRKL